jgi:hypothetical protein
LQAGWVDLVLFFGMVFELLGEQEPREKDEKTARKIWRAKKE